MHYIGLCGSAKTACLGKMWFSTFPYYHKNHSTTVQRKQFPIKLAFAVTLHDSQGSTLEYVKVSSDRTSKTGKANTVPINQVAAYTVLSRTKSRAILQCLNFNQQHIKFNVAALNEMKRMREHAVFSWQHPIAEGSGNKEVLSNVRLRNAHIEQFITNTEITKYCDIMCFTDTYTNGSNFTKISNYL